MSKLPPQAGDLPAYNAVLSFAGDSPGEFNTLQIVIQAKPDDRVELVEGSLRINNVLLTPLTGDFVSVQAFGEPERISAATPARGKMRHEFHVIPRHAQASHVPSKDCLCKPVQRDKESSGSLAVWQHNEPGLEHPLMVGGLMSSSSWIIFKQF